MIDTDLFYTFSFYKFYIFLLNWGWFYIKLIVIRLSPRGVRGSPRKLDARGGLY